MLEWFTAGRDSWGRLRRVYICRTTNDVMVIEVNYGRLIRRRNYCLWPFVNPSNIL